MQLPKSLSDLTNKLTQKVKEYQKPAEEKPYDKFRIDREMAYAKRLRQVNPKLKNLNDRRRKIQQRRTRP